MKKTECRSVLGLKQNFSDKELKRAYFKLAKIWHPDVNKEEGAELKFVEIKEAYERLINNDFQENVVRGHSVKSKASPFQGQNRMSFKVLTKEECQFEIRNEMKMALMLFPFFVILVWLSVYFILNAKWLTGLDVGGFHWVAVVLLNLPIGIPIVLSCKRIFNFWEKIRRLG